MSVERLSFSASVLAGEQGNTSNTMALGSLAFPIRTGLSAQVDLGLGVYDTDYSSTVAAARLFWRYEDHGAVGVYLDYANVNPEHAGRIGLEGAYYFDRVTIEALFGLRNGTNVYREGFDEVDVTYYVTDDLKASLGHRMTTRGDVGNVGFEYAPDALAGWTLFGEAEMGEDDNHSAFAGMRFTFDGGRYTSLKARDRSGPMRVRAPRGIVDVTRCGALPEKKDTVSFGVRQSMSVLCASADELADEGATEGKKTK